MKQETFEEIWQIRECQDSGRYTVVLKYDVNFLTLHDVIVHNIPEDPS